MITFQKWYIIYKKNFKLNKKFINNYDYFDLIEDEIK